MTVRSGWTQELAGPLSLRIDDGARIDQRVVTTLS